MGLRPLTVGNACQRGALPLHVTCSGYSHPLAMPGGDPSQLLVRLRIRIRHKI